MTWVVTIELISHCDFDIGLLKCEIIYRLTKVAENMVGLAFNNFLTQNRKQKLTASNWSRKMYKKRKQAILEKR